MFKDCKINNYNFEECHVIKSRLSAIVLLIAIVYVTATIQGIDIKTLRVKLYVYRPKEQARIQRRHSNF